MSPSGPSSVGKVGLSHTYCCRSLCITAHHWLLGDFISRVSTPSMHRARSSITAVYVNDTGRSRSAFPTLLHYANGERPTAGLDFA